MKLTLERIYKGSDYTIGKLYIDGKYFCDTLEDTLREFKIKHKTCIPVGTYKVIISYSPRFKVDMPLLVNVPNFDGIRIHSGNTKEDSSGCILVGFNKVRGKVLDSKKTYNALFKILKACTEPISIEIK